MSRELKKIEEYSDSELIAIYKNKEDKTVLGELFKRYTGFVFLISMKYLKNEETAKDAVMQIFEKLFVDLKKHEIANFKAWLHIVTKNYCLLYLRSENYTAKKEKELKKETKKNMENSENFHHINDEGKDEKEEKLQKLESAINELNEEQKICLDLFYLQQKSYQEVADVTGYNLNQVKSYIQNGKRNLKIFLERSGITLFVNFLIYIFN